MIISVASGKGGIGKTSLMTAFSSLIEDKVLCDADVEAADLHLILNPNVIRRSDFQSGKTALSNCQKGNVNIDLAIYVVQNPPIG